MAAQSKQRTASSIQLQAARYTLCALSLMVSACVPLSQLPPGSVEGVEQAAAQKEASETVTFPDIDPGGTQVTTLHFVLRGYTDADLRPISVMAESLYNKIGSDTGLYSYLAGGQYKILVYKDRAEYLTKTKLPDWSRAVASGDTLYLYPGLDLEPVLAHEMTHLLFNSFMGQEAALKYRWINEGLAMNQEMSKVTDGSRSYPTSANSNIRQNRIPFSQMTFFTPLTEEKRAVDTWYQQVQSVVSYLLNQGSALNFAGMLTALRNGIDIDRAIADNYPGKFRNLIEVENAWKYTI